MNTLIHKSSIAVATLALALTGCNPEDLADQNQDLTGLPDVEDTVVELTPQEAFLTSISGTWIESEGYADEDGFIQGYSLIHINEGVFATGEVSCNTEACFNGSLNDDFEIYIFGEDSNVTIELENEVDLGAGYTAFVSPTDDMSLYLALETGSDGRLWIGDDEAWGESEYYLEAFDLPVEFLIGPDSNQIVQNLVGSWFTEEDGLFSEYTFTGTGFVYATEYEVNDGERVILDQWDIGYYTSSENSDGTISLLIFDWNEPAQVAQYFETDLVEVVTETNETRLYMSGAHGLIDYDFWLVKD